MLIVGGGSTELGLTSKLSDVSFGSRLCKNVCCYFCVARLWVWMICRDGFAGFPGFRGWLGHIDRLAPL